MADATAAAAITTTTAVTASLAASSKSLLRRVLRPPRGCKPHKLRPKGRDRKLAGEQVREFRRVCSRTRAPRAFTYTHIIILADSLPHSLRPPLSPPFAFYAEPFPFLSGSLSVCLFPPVSLLSLSLRFFHLSSSLFFHGETCRRTGARGEKTIILA